MGYSKINWFFHEVIVKKNGEKYKCKVKQLLLHHLK